MTFHPNVDLSRTLTSLENRTDRTTHWARPSLASGGRLGLFDFSHLWPAGAHIKRPNVLDLAGKVLHVEVHRHKNGSGSKAGCTTIRVVNSSIRKTQLSHVTGFLHWLYALPRSRRRSGQQSSNGNSPVGWQTMSAVKAYQTAKKLPTGGLTIDTLKSLKVMN